MKLEAGKTYLDRVGSVLTVELRDKNCVRSGSSVGAYPFISSGGTRTWMTDGRWRDLPGWHVYDLIAEVPTAATDKPNPEKPNVTHRSHRNIDMLSPQAIKVLEHLEASGSITNCEAHTVLKCRSVSRRITELQDAGFDVDKTHSRDSQGQRYVRYSLV
jgi:hypothetical protein